jgi:hypothetical protein
LYLKPVGEIASTAAAAAKGSEVFMVNPLEIMPVLAMAVLITFIPVLSDGPHATERSSKARRGARS